MKLGELIRLEHEWTKEIRSLPLESFTEQYLYVRWDLAGLYEIKLASGRLRACSVAARRRSGPAAGLWYAIDIVELRKRVKEHFKPNDTENRMTRHQANMPFIKKPQT